MPAASTPMAMRISISISLTTRFRELFSGGRRALYAFSAGVLLNIVLEFMLSTQVFADFWASLGQ